MIFATNYYICIRWWIINYLLGNVWRRKGIRYVRVLRRWARSVRQASPGRRSALQHQAPRDLRCWNGTRRRQVFFVIFCTTSLLLQRVISVFYNSTSLSHAMQNAMSWRRWVLKIMKAGDKDNSTKDPSWLWFCCKSIQFCELIQFWLPELGSPFEGVWFSWG